MKETAEEYLKRVTREAKEFYKSPDKLIDENIRLLSGIKEHIKDEDKLWDFAVAVSEAYHVVLYVNNEDRPKRLINTIVSWVKNNTTGI